MLSDKPSPTASARRKDAGDEEKSINTDN